MLSEDKKEQLKEVLHSDDIVAKNVHDVQTSRSTSLFALVAGVISLAVCCNGSFYMVEQLELNSMEVA